MTLAGLSPAGALIVRAGEPFALQVGYVDENGAAMDLTGRIFALAFRYTDQTTPFLTINAELDGHALTAVALGTGEQASQIYAAGVGRRLSYDFMELTGGATSSRLTERVAVEPGSDIPGEVVPQYMDLPLLAVTVAAQRKLVVERGRPGFGAERRLYDAGLIEAPTVDAMNEYLRGAGIEGATPILEGAQAAKNAAESSAEQAESERSLAQQARVASEANAAFAQAASPIYPDIATGMAAVAEDGYFSVRPPTGEPQTFSKLYRKVSGAPIFIDDYPNKAALNLRIQPKASVRVAAPASMPITTTAAGSVVDGVTLQEGDRWAQLAANQPYLNGIFVAGAAGAGSTRAADMAAPNQFPGAQFAVLEGVANGGTVWTCVNSENPTVGTTAILFRKDDDLIRTRQLLADKTDLTTSANDRHSRMLGDASTADMVEEEFMARADLIRPVEGGLQLGQKREVVEEQLPGTLYMLEIDDKVYLRVDEAEFVEIESEREEVPGALRVTVDEQDNIIALVLEDGTTTVRAAPVASARTGLRAGLCHIIGVGQSWMGGTGGAPALTVTSMDRLLMFVGGIRPTDVLAAPDAYASLVPAVEANNTGNVRGETPMSGFARSLIERIGAEDGYTLADAGVNMLVSVVAPGGLPIINLARNSTYFAQIMEQFDAGRARAAAMGTSYRLLCCPVILGKGDYDIARDTASQVPRDPWAANLAALVKDVNEAVRARVPDHPDVHFVVLHTGSHGHASLLPNVDLAINQLDRENALIWFGGPLYPYQRAPGDTVHFTGAAYRQAGAVAGVIAKRIAVDAVDPHAMLPVEYRAGGNVISVMFDPARTPLALDGAAVGNPENAGFTLVDAAGAALTIASVTAWRDRVDVVASAALPAEWSLRYGWTGALVAGAVSGPRGSLRDSQGVSIRLDPAGLNIPLHNWAGLFEIHHKGA